jgi:hypothetical protein
MKLVFLTANQRWYVVFGQEIVECYGCHHSWESRKDAIHDLKKLALAVDRKNNITAVGVPYSMTALGVSNGETLDSEVSVDFCTCGVCE